MIRNISIPVSPQSVKEYMDIPDILILLAVVQETLLVVDRGSSYCSLIYFFLVNTFHIFNVFYC